MFCIVLNGMYIYVVMYWIILSIHMTQGMYILYQKTEK